MVTATQYSFLCDARALLQHYDDAVGISNCKKEKLNSIGPKTAKLWHDAMRGTDFILF